MRILFIMFSSAFYIHIVQAQIYNIVQFGAIGDSVTVNTSAIQKAIDTCHQKGGGVVLVPKGVFVTGTIRMKSNVELRIDSGAILKGSSNLSEYPQITPAIRNYTDNYVQRSLIYAEGVHHIAFTGKGTIDFNGLAPVFVNSSNRAYGFRIYDSRHVRYEDLTLINSAFWMMHNCLLDTVTIRNLTITNHCYGNQDGINLDLCSNVLVENCNVDSNNNPIVLKGTSTRSCANVEVRNCTLATYSRAIKIGTETQGFFKNIYIHDCVVKKSTRGPLNLDAKCGINLAIVDGGGMDGVTIENIQLEAITPIVIRLGNMARKHEPNAPTPGVGYVKNIRLKNIVATATSNITSHITGIPGHQPENIILENVSLTVPGGMGNVTNVYIPENENKRPEHDLFGDTLPAYGIFIRHIKNISLCNVKITLKQPDDRPPFYTENVNRIDTTCTLHNADINLPTIRVYPNPATDALTIESDGSHIYEIFDLFGKLVLKSEQKSISLVGLAKGNYVLKSGNQTLLFTKE